MSGFWPGKLVFVDLTFEEKNDRTFHRYFRLRIVQKTLSELLSRSDIISVILMSFITFDISVWFSNIQVDEKIYSYINESFEIGKWQSKETNVKNIVYHVYCRKTDNIYTDNVLIQNQSYSII